MRYLECIELLNLALQLLRDGQREQVPLSRLAEVQILVMRLRTRLTDIPIAASLCDDITGAITIAQSNKSVMNLSQRMRDILVTGLHDCLSAVCEAGWEYYSNHDVPISETTIPLLTILVSNHFNRGV